MKPLTEAYRRLVNDGNRNLALVISALQDCGGEDMTSKQAEMIVRAIIQSLGGVKFPDPPSLTRETKEFERRGRISTALKDQMNEYETWIAAAAQLRQHAGDREEASSQSEGAPSPAEPPAPTCPECGAVRIDLGYWRATGGYPGCRNPWHDREES